MAVVVTDYLGEASSGLSQAEASSARDPRFFINFFFPRSNGAERRARLNVQGLCKVPFLPCPALSLSKAYSRALWCVWTRCSASSD